MWPFNKDLKQAAAVVMKTIICIPGFWNNLSELCEKSGGRLTIKGNILLDVKNKVEYEIELCDRDARMGVAFMAAGMHSGLSDIFINLIQQHSSVVYIVGKTGDLESARLMSIAVGIILESGGIGAKVESAGKSFERDRWIELSAGDDGEIYKLFVIEPLMKLDGSVHSIYSCGMHNIGLKDTIITVNEFVDIPNAEDILSFFNYYQVIDKPVIQAGEGFRLGMDYPRYIISDERNQPNKGEELFENAFGMWRLTKE